MDAKKQAEQRPFDHYMVPRFTSFKIPDEIEMRPNLSKQEQTVIIDAGIAIEDNIAFLKSKKHLHYIVVNRGKGEFTPEDTNDMRVIFKDDDTDFKVEVNMRLCSLPETVHKIIYHRLGLSDLPLGRRCTIENL